jgi:hypothetical protein
VRLAKQNSSLDVVKLRRLCQVSFRNDKRRPTHHIDIMIVEVRTI